MKVVVLRLGHRPLRDKRVTTHVALVARAFGAQGVVLGAEDENVKASVVDIVERWGGDFFVESTADWRKYLKEWRGSVVHLTMYGMPVDDVIGEVRAKGKDILVTVGSEKMPRGVFDLADYNVSVTNQPHSEVAALAIFLDKLFQGQELKRDFGGRIKVIPSERSKKVMN